MGESTASARKQHERFFLEHFLRVARVAAEVVDDSKEAPDILIRVDMDLVGVELSELFVERGAPEGPLQAQETIARRILRKAQDLYRAAGGTHAHVLVHFSPSSDLRRLSRDETAAQLAAFVKSQALRPEELRRWIPGHASGALPAAITCINMLGVPEAGMAHWSAPGGAWVAPLTAEILQARVDEKASLLPKYRERVERNWLLLVSDGGRPSQFFDPPTAAVASLVSSPFTRTFYFGRFAEVVVELGVPANDA